MMKIKDAFTLSEVLLVLAVIGVVAALTIPTLIQKVGDDQMVSTLKKVYSTLSQAHYRIVGEYGGDFVTSNAFGGNGDAASDVQALNAFEKYFNIVKNCGSGTGCLPNTMAKRLDGSVYYNNFDSELNGLSSKAILADGAILRVDDKTGNCSNDGGDGPLDGTVCGSVHIDVNGMKSPNTYGRDIFVFHVTRDGIYPRGIYNDGYECTSLGEGCAARVLTEGKINY